MRKFIVLSFLVILLPFLRYFIDENLILDSDVLLWAALIILGTFIVIKNSNKYGLLLWIASFAGPRIYNSISAFSYLSEDINIWYLVIHAVCQLAICMCFCRLALQWTISVWLPHDQLTETTKKSLHFFWKSFICLEELLFIAVAAVFTEVVATFLGNVKLMDNALFRIIPCWGVYTIYKRVKLNSLRILSPIAVKLENEKINADIDKALNEKRCQA